MEPEVSVLMPVFNGAEFVGRAADSILRQTLRNLELIIIDDGSTDNTWTVLEKLAERDRRVHICRNKSNVGMPRTSNRALSLSKGQFIARQDADDWSYPERLEKQLCYMKGNDECVALGSQMLVVNSDWLPTRLTKFPLSHEEIEFRHINGFGMQLPHPTMVVRAEAMRLIGGYREEFLLSDDYDLILRLAEIGKVRNLTDVLVRYMKHENSITILRKEDWSMYKHRALLQAWDRRGMGTPPFNTIPNPSLRFREGSRTVSLFIYGLKNVLRNPGSHEGRSALKGSAARLIRKRKKR